MEKIEATFRIVTPMFMGGADQNKAELRVPSIKAALRFWYRAIDPEYKENEAGIFGGSGDKQGQSMFLLRLGKSITGQPWGRNSFNDFDKMHPNFNNRTDHSSANRNTWQLNGIRYLGFSLFMGENITRQAIPAGTEFTLELLFKKRPDTQDRKRIAAALWLLGHFGSLGTRSRRGFGVLSLQSLTVKKGEQWPEIDPSLKYAKDAKNHQDWLNIYKETLAQMKSWFPGSMFVDHTVFSKKTKICVTDTKRACRNRDEWEYALDTAGKIMQEFRQRWDLSQPNSDYFVVKKHICANDPQAAKQVPELTPSPLQKIPKKVAFGLPLQFQYSSLKYPQVRQPPGILFEGGDEKHPRSASRIWVRIAEIGGKAYPVFIRMDGPLLPPADSIKIKDKKKTYDQPNDDILDDFWESISKPQEIEWGIL